MKSVSPVRILVIEDNPGDVAILRYALSEHEKDYRLDLLRDGEEALRFVQDERSFPSEEPHPCVIVLDIHLPKHDGPRVLEAIRAEPALSHVHVVVLTTIANPRQEHEVRRLGVRLYRTKPSELTHWVMLAQEILDICRERIAATASNVS